MKAKSPWFDVTCIKAKRELNILAKKYGRDPKNNEIRITYYSKKRDYKKLVKTKKKEFFDELSRDVEDNKNINWGRFKKLRTLQQKGPMLDVFDMLNFCKFFEGLYGKPSLPKHITEEMKLGTISSQKEDLQDSLDQLITIEELDKAISELKSGKAVSEDLIANEFIKACSETARKAICNLFNECLRTGIYPWNTSVVTPLHKKGDIYNPDNYRAIAVASNIGKLFSTILLQRLIEFRNSRCPDTPNQLGFRKEAQTCDHILTLNTCIAKYTDHIKKGRLYTCFVDFSKAFDTVCREALLFKIWNLGASGNFFRCLENMHTNSTAKVKLLSKLSKQIGILCGTEQGHPMSPELCKCYIQNLSEQLNAMGDIEVPILNSVSITHLLWADDLVLTALNPKSLQAMLKVLHNYCTEWGLTVNLEKRQS